MVMPVPAAVFLVVMSYVPPLNVLESSPYVPSPLASKAIVAGKRTW